MELVRSGVAAVLCVFVAAGAAELLFTGAPLKQERV